MPATLQAEKIDLFKQHKSEYAAKPEPALLNIARAKYLAIEGQGKPGGEAFEEKIGAMYQTAYTLKMASKFAGRDYKVCALEGLWWSADPSRCIAAGPDDNWCWKLLIRVPDFVTKANLAAAHAALEKKGKGELPKQVHLETLEEGRVVQALHVGPYSSVSETIARMRAFAEANRVEFHGLHHEIYLSDPRRVPPERLKTILRIPVA